MVSDKSTNGQGRGQKLMGIQTEMGTQNGRDTDGRERESDTDRQGEVHRRTR